MMAPSSTTALVLPLQDFPSVMLLFTPSSRTNCPEQNASVISNASDTYRKKHDTQFQQNQRSDCISVGLIDLYGRERNYFSIEHHSLRGLRHDPSHWLLILPSVFFALEKIIQYNYG